MKKNYGRSTTMFSVLFDIFSRNVFNFVVPCDSNKLSSFLWSFGLEARWKTLVFVYLKKRNKNQLILICLDFLVKKASVFALASDGFCVRLLLTVQGFKRSFGGTRRLEFEVAWVHGTKRPYAATNRNATCSPTSAHNGVPVPTAYRLSSIHRRTRRLPQLSWKLSNA